MLAILFFVPQIFVDQAIAATDHDLGDVKETIAKFHRVPAEHMFCSARGTPWEPGGDSEKVLPEMAHFLSTELLMLFAWMHCGTPEYPSPSMRERNKYLWDFRYGLRPGESDPEPSRVKNLRVLNPHIADKRKIAVTILFLISPQPQQAHVASQ